MNDTCTTHRSRVPRRSFGRVKWGVTTVEDERGPGLDFSLCFVCGSRPWGAAAFHLCLFILLLNGLNVRRFPPPSSRIYQLRYKTLIHHLVSFIALWRRTETVILTFNRLESIEVHYMDTNPEMFSSKTLISVWLKKEIHKHLGWHGSE